jgi:hypothetical protein
MAKQATKIGIERDSGTGRFGAGNKAAAGRRVLSAELREAMVASVTPEDIRVIMAALVKAASGGDVAASKLLFDRVIGKLQTEAPGGVRMLESAGPMRLAGPVVLEDSDLPADHATFSDILKGVFDAPKIPVEQQPVKRSRTRKAAR